MIRIPLCAGLIALFTLIAHAQVVPHKEGPNAGPATGTIQANAGHTNQLSPQGLQDPAMQPVPATQGSAPQRRIAINGTALNSNQISTLQALEMQFGARVPDGAYWYDAVTGMWGTWGGPTLGYLAPHLDFPAPMPAHCSGGGTGVFLNGRELHPLDVVTLQQITGPVMPGRYWMDGMGNVGWEGQPASFNLFALAQQAAQAQGGTGPSSVSGLGGSVHSDGQGFIGVLTEDGSWSNQ